MNIKKFNTYKELFEINPESESFFKQEIYVVALNSFIDYDEWLNSPVFGSYISGSIKEEGSLIDIYKRIEEQNFPTEIIVFEEDLEVNIGYVFDFQKIFVLGDFSAKGLTNKCGCFYVRGESFIKEVLHFDSNDGGFTKLKLANEVFFILTNANFFDINLRAKCFIDPSFQAELAGSENANGHTNRICSTIQNRQNTTFYTPKEYVDFTFKKESEETSISYYELDTLVDILLAYTYHNKTQQLLDALKENENVE